MTEKQFEHLKKQYKIAVDRGLNSFQFYGETLLTTYAKYMIEAYDAKKNKNR